jgi:3-oxoacyl-[acyl-carrier protein] reductase
MAFFLACSKRIGSANLEFGARQAGRSLEDERARALSGIPADRFGQAEEFGAIAAFLCCSHAGFITGQNIVVDGGAFLGLP